MIEFPDEDERKVRLSELVDIENRTYVQIQGYDRVYAIADEDLERANTEKPAPFISRDSNSQPRWSRLSRMARLSRWDQTTRSITTALMKSILRHRAVSLKTLNNQRLGRKVRFFGRAFIAFFQNRAITLENSPKNPYSPNVASKIRFLRRKS